MYRTALERLKDWRLSDHRLPLIIRGARQVGKTWLMKEFGRTCFDNCAYVNFENNPRMKALFEMDFDIRRILLGLQVETGQHIVPGKTLVLFDEVQEVPKALSSLKYFRELASDYDIIAAGSLLGVALHPDESFPVGKVEFLDLFPLSFPEFLAAVGNEALRDLGAGRDFQLMGAFATKLTDLLAQYLVVGGMPEAVNCFVGDRDLGAVRHIQKGLLLGFEQDFSKHVPHSLVPRIRDVFHSLPAQLARENRKFVYGLIRQGARAREYELAIQWLADCGLVHRVARVTKPGVPLQAYEDRGAFKLYALDVGLLCAMSDLDAQVLLEGARLFEEFKGALAEQYVLQQLVAHAGIRPFYWSADKATAEVDFVLQTGGEVIPVEVKAAENLRSKSLKSFVDRYHPPVAIRTSLSGYREEEWLINLPLYAIHDIAGVVAAFRGSKAVPTS